MLSGVHSPGNILFPFVVMLAGWMLGVRWLIVWTVATLVFLVALAFAELQGWFIPSGRANPLVTIVTYMAVMPIVAFMTWSMRSILVEGRQQTQVLLREQEQKNQKLLQFEADMQAFMENMPAAVASFDLDSRLVRCNSRYAALFGSTPVALCGSVTRDYVPGVVLDQITTQWELAYQGQEQSYLRFNINPLTKDITWVDCRLKPAYRDRQQVGLDAVLVDVTEKVQAAEKIRALNTELEQRVEQRTQELLNARSALQESRDELIRSQAKAGLSAMVASVSHELGTPLGNSVLVASTFVEITGELERMVTSGALRKSNLLQTLQALKEGSDQLQSNLRRAELLLINFRQVSADQASEQRRTFDLEKMVEEIINSMGPSLRRSPHRVLHDIPPGIVMDSLPGPLGQVLINLINNALIHAFEGMHQGQVRIGARLTDDRVQLTVQDNGRGMAPDVQKRLFEPFFSTRIGQGGTGLGMSIVESIVTRSLGGAMRVVSRIDHGTQFELDLPRTLPDENPKTPSP
jgi:PAS domain S-box-containing protein